MTVPKQDIASTIANALRAMSVDAPQTLGNSDGDAKPTQYLPLFDQGGHFYLWHIAGELGVATDVAAALNHPEAPNAS